MAVNLLMMLFLPIETWLRLAGWLVIGLAIYWLYGRHHSVLGKTLRLEQGQA
jgi:APA family basic amino acid/polyamine antiporter